MEGKRQSDLLWGMMNYKVLKKMKRLRGMLIYLRVTCVYEREANSGGTGGGRI